MGPSKALHRVARITGEQQVLHTYYADHLLRLREVHREFSREQRMGSTLLQFEPYVFMLLSVASYTSAFKSSICPYTPCFLAYEANSKSLVALRQSVEPYLELDQTSSSSSVPKLIKEVVDVVLQIVDRHAFGAGMGGSSRDRTCSLEWPSPLTTSRPGLIDRARVVCRFYRR